MRRTAFLAVAALLVAGVIAMGMPATAPAQSKPIVLKVQIPVPVVSVLFENLKMYAEYVERMSGGRLKIEALPGGAVVPAWQEADAASRGVLDGGHSWVGYWTGRNPAAGILAGAPAGSWGMDQLDYYGWYHEGGGLELLQEFYDTVGFNVVTLGPVAGVGPQHLGWFKKPVENLAEFRKMKYRVPGIAADVYKEMGVTVTVLPGGEIVPAGERGVLDGAEWLTPADDIKMGFHTVWKYLVSPAFHDYTPTWDIYFNKEVWKKIPADLQEILKGAAQATAFRHWLRFNRQNAEALGELKKLGVTMVETPEEINRKFLETWEKVAEREAAKHPLVRKVLDSQRNYARLVQTYRLTVNPPYGFAARYFLERKTFLERK